MELEQLARPDGPWLIPLTCSPSEAFDLAQALRRAGRGRVASRVLRGRKMATSARLLDEVAAVLQFPPYFGDNWAALEECLTDLEWLPADVYVLTILDTVRLLDGEAAERQMIFWETLRTAALEWSLPAGGSQPRPGKAFRVLAQSTSAEVDRARELFPAGEAGPFIDLSRRASPVRQMGG